MRPGPARDALRIAAHRDRPSRRRVLQAVGMAAAATVLPAVPVEAVRASPSPQAARRAPKVVIIGAGMAGLGCALRLRDAYGIDADIYEYAERSGGRIRTLRGRFAHDQLVEEHAEFINPEHTATLALAKRFGLSLDNTDRYPEPRQDQLTLRFHGKQWSQKQLRHDWHRFGWKLFHDAAVNQAPWPTTYTRSTPAGRRFDAMSVAEWVEAYVPGGVASDFGQLCISAVLDEYGGPADEQSALNLVYLLGGDASRKSGNQPKSGPVLEGADEKWHVKGGNDQLVTGILKRLKPGAVAPWPPAGIGARSRPRALRRRLRIRSNRVRRSRRPRVAVHHSA